MAPTGQASRFLTPEWSRATRAADMVSSHGGAAAATEAR
jgi:hypothetical protein